MNYNTRINLPIYSYRRNMVAFVKKKKNGGRSRRTNISLV